MSTTSSPQVLCARIAQRLAQSVGPQRYNMWFGGAARLDYRDRENKLELAVPNRFVADWIGRHFTSQLHQAAQSELGQDVSLSVEVKSELFPSQAASANGHESAQPAERNAVASGGVPRRAGSSLRHGLDDFVVGPTNELAFDAARRLAEESQDSPSSLFLHGGCGLGKTHLLQGICRRMLEQDPQARVHYCTGEQFTNEFLAAMRANRIEEFRRRIRRLDLLAIDDVHFLANKQATQQEFLHSFDAMGLGGARVVLASDSHPKLIQQFSQALINRCVCGMVVEVRAPDPLTRARLVRALAQRRGMTLLDAAVDALASRCVGSVREIEGALSKLHALARLDEQRRPAADAAQPQAPIGYALAQRLFEDQFSDTPRRAVGIQSILQIVCGRLGTTPAHVMGSSRMQNVVLARSLTIHLARRMTSMSYPEIAAALGRKNHSTIITAAQRVEKQLAAGLMLMLPATDAAGAQSLALSDLAQTLQQSIIREAP